MSDNELAALRKQVAAADKLAETADAFCSNEYEIIPLLNAIAAYRRAKKANT